MAEWRSHSPSNKPGTCLWCGQKLRLAPFQGGVYEKDARGDYGDNLFCGLRCGYQFGLQMAKWNHRIKPNH